MKFTGERYIPSEKGQIRLEHYHRYIVTLDIINGKDVLDVACGEGYGSFFMSDYAKSVVGVDISEEAIDHASAVYVKPNLQFLQGSATDLEFPDNSFDVVVSFETIEHLAEQERMLAEIRRVLRPEGILIISSPNRPVYSEESGEHNEFHVKELDYHEFDALLRVQFPKVEYFGQRLLISSVIQSLSDTPSKALIWSDDGSRVNAKAGYLKDPVYFLALCGADSVNFPHIEMSVLYPEAIDLVKHYVGFAKWAKSLEKIVAERDAKISNLNDNLVRIKRSYSWRVTMPLREAGRWLTMPTHQAKRYTRATLRFAKKIYESLPLSYPTKAKHRLFVAKTFPRLLTFANLPVLEALPSLPTNPLYKPLFSHQSRDELLAYLKRFELAIAEAPIVSIIIPVYGKVDYTLRCLASIVTHLPKIAFEIIVVDDGSPDDSFATLASFAWIKLIRNTQNQGFIVSCNKGASVARGRYLCFLNNDTEVTPNWLEELLVTFDYFPGTGLVGSKLIYPDGKLQEAGGIIWQDGSAWNFGRYQDPALPVYNYAREVDYCSGASIMVPKALFCELGGFDEYYAPAYCEDADLALKIRDKGYRVIYQPLSTVIHDEGVTSGTDLTQGVKSHQVINACKLFERWQPRLSAHQAPGIDVDNAKDRRAARRVLVLDHCTPTPNQDAGSVTVFNLLLLLREMDFQVTFIPEDNFLYMPEYTAALQRNGIEVLYAPYHTSVKQHLNEAGGRYDLAFLFRPGVVERHLQAIRKYCPNAKVLFHTTDLHFLRMEREATLQQDPAKQKASKIMRERELAIMQSVDATIVHSTAELELLRPMLPNAKLHVFPLILDVKGTTQGFAERRDLVFVGGYQHTPNVDAVKYFVAEIMPLLRQRLPGVRFYAVGSKPPAEIKALESDDVIITGFVEDLNPLLDKMRVSVAPLRYGAGIKGKIGTAMVVGLPVVATSLAVEGMSLTDGENILVADGAAAFAEAVVRIYQDETLWNRISTNGLAFAEQAWGAEAAWNIFASILADLGMKVTRNPYPLKLYSETPVTKNHLSRSLQPVGTARTREEFMQLQQHPNLLRVVQVEQALLAQCKGKAFTVEGFCVPCDKPVQFLVDMQSGGQRHAHGWTPNWRERLECPSCRMNNRQRLMAALVKQALAAKPNKKVYFMEQVTPIFHWVKATFSQHQIIGSEYLGHEYESGSVINGMRHEDVENLSFGDDTLDLIVSNDVFEHVPNPAKAFSECARVLKPGGIMLATIPFHCDKDSSVVRAKLIDGKLEHLHPPVFHGNPVSAEGSLVFTDFGWDLLDTIRQSGFADVGVDIYASEKFGHLGDGQLVFRLSKRESA